MQNLSCVEVLLANKHATISALNSMVESGDKLFNTTAAEGKEAIRSQLHDVQQSVDNLYDKIVRLERDLQGKLTKWAGYEESSATFGRWLSEIQEQLKGDMVLKTTLDEKKGQLQIYRNILQDVKTQKPVLDDLAEKSGMLPEKSEKIDSFITAAVSKHKEVLNKAQGYVEKYEAFVADHQQYTKAVMEASEWLNATLNTVEMWGDTSLERLSLHANLERLKNLQLTLPEEEPRTTVIKTVGEKVIPGTIQSGQSNIKAQIDTSSQEWQGLVSTVKSTIESLEQKIQQWAEFENIREDCLAWLKDTDTRLHTFNLQSNLTSKIEQLEMLKTLQGQIKAKELEIDAVTERAQQLNKGLQSMRTSQLTELTVKYQQVNLKVKDLTGKWQQYVKTHNDYDTTFDACQQWIGEKNQELAKVSEMTMGSQEAIDQKVKAISDLILSKDEGFAKVQNTVELAQSVLANTSTSGHDEIKKQINDVQTSWSNLASKLAESKLLIEDSIHKWASFLDQVGQLNKTMHNIEKSYNDIEKPRKPGAADKRSDIEKLKNLEEKMKCERIEIDQVKTKTLQMQSQGYNNQGTKDAVSLADRFDKLLQAIRNKLSDSENQHKDYKAYKVAQETLGQYLQRCKDKLHTMRQRSPNDKNYVDAVTQALDHLLNKEAQGQILVEQLQQAGDVLLTTAPESGKSGIKADIARIVDDFNALFKDIKQQREQMGKIINVFQDFKEETERLSDWMQQADINTKAAKTSLLATIEEKEKAVEDMDELHKKLTKGQADIDKYNEMAEKMKNSCLEANVMTQQKETFAKYQITCNFSADVLKKISSIYDQHYEFEANVAYARKWMDKAWCTIRENTTSEGKSKDDLHSQLDTIRALIQTQEEGQKFIHDAIDWGEKTLRNTRSDGREKINQAMKDLQVDWEKLAKKMSTAKVSVETDLLQWSDAQQSVSRLQEWIDERENRLKQVSQNRHVMLTRRSTLGISTLSVSERTAALRRTNSILQDIQAFEPMIQSVAANTSEAPASEITTKYHNLSKQAQELYDKEKEMVDKHELFMEAGHEFMNWLRFAKEKLSRCSEPTGDKESLAGKVAQLRVLEGEMDEGEKKLEEALRTAAEACLVALEEDRDIVEEEVAFLQDEYDQFTEQLGRVKTVLEGGIVRWTDYQEMYQDALDYLKKAEDTVQGFNKFQVSLPEKRKVLEDFQVELQKIFDWQKELDNLNRKGQTLLETCADSRVSNAITQLSTKYQALISLAKDVMRRLEVYFQEHHQHNALYQDCQSFIDTTRERLEECKRAENTHESLNEKLNDLREIRQSFEQGQNKLRYVLELKERVILNTEQKGAKKIEKDTSAMKTDFDKLIEEMQDIKTNLGNRFDLLGDIDKSNKLLMEWIEEAEEKSQYENLLFNDLGEKRANLEKNKAILRDVESHRPTVNKLEQKIKDHPNIPNKGFSESILRFNKLTLQVQSNIAALTDHVQSHEAYKETYTEASDWIRRIKIELQQSGDSHGEKEDAIKKQEKIGELIDSLQEGDTLIRNVIRYSANVQETTADEGKDIIKQDDHQLKYEWEQVRNQAKQSKKNLDKCVSAWNDFEDCLKRINSWIGDFHKKVDSESQRSEKSTEDLERRREMLREANKQKYDIENLNDKCEVLMEFSACSHVRDRTVNVQAAYTNLYTTVQALLSKTEKTVADHSDFNRARDEFDEWYLRANGTVMDSANTDGSSAEVKEKISQLKTITSRMTEGQHLLNCVTESFSTVAAVTPDGQVGKMRETLKELKDKYDQLSLSLGDSLSSLQRVLHRWNDVDAAIKGIEDWVNDMKGSLRESTDSRGELGEMKTLLERYKGIEDEIQKKKAELKQVREAACELSALSKDQNIISVVDKLEVELGEYETACKGIKSSFEEEISDYADYQKAMQDTEKWLLQMQFQLMAHNSLYITTRDQTNEQVNQHEKLMGEIKDYQGTLDVVREKGNAQIAKYVYSRPDIRATIEKQHQNFQESYNSLLQTGTQIKNRLLDSLSKFQEYEDALDSILKDLETLEPQIKEDVDKPIEEIEDPQAEFEKIRVSHESSISFIFNSYLCHFLCFGLMSYVYSPLLSFYFYFFASFVPPLSFSTLCYSKKFYQLPLSDFFLPYPWRYSMLFNLKLAHEQTFGNVLMSRKMTDSRLTITETNLAVIPYTSYLLLPCITKPKPPFLLSGT